MELLGLLSITNRVIIKPGKLSMYACKSPIKLNCNFERTHARLEPEIALKAATYKAYLE